MDLCLILVLAEAVYYFVSLCQDLFEEWHFRSCPEYIAALKSLKERAEQAERAAIDQGMSFEEYCEMCSTDTEFLVQELIKRTYSNPCKNLQETMSDNEEDEDEEDGHHNTHEEEEEEEGSYDPRHQ